MTAPAPTRFAADLQPFERDAIVHELRILASVRTHLATVRGQGRRPDNARELLELRDSLSDAREEDVPQLLAMMENLTALADHQDKGEPGALVRRGSPYFGHIRVEQEGKTRDVLIGNASLLDGELPCPIVDWRQSPISALYYSYREGEPFEEELGGKRVQGRVLIRRALTIRDGRLLHIRSGLSDLRRDQDGWRRDTRAFPALHGGQGQAVRAGTVAGLHLGVEPAGPREQRHLPDITALIDRNQFDLITRPESGLVVVDGGAGSGKTTIALHRVAFLAFRDPERFPARDLLVVVFNRALAAYISRLLPALGVEGVPIVVFEDYAAQLRQRHYPNLIVRHTEATPLAVMRFKQHPVAIERLKAVASALRQSIGVEIGKELEGSESRARVLEAWESLGGEPLAIRLERMLRWALGKQPLPDFGSFGADWVAQRRLSKILLEQLPDPNSPFTVPQSIWEEAYLDRAALAEAAARHAPGEFGESDLDEVHHWALRAAQEREAYREWQQARKEGVREERDPDDPGEPPPEPPQIDREDDTLLLLLYQTLVGPLRGKRSRPLRLKHLTVDEAQDFGALDLSWLMALVAEPGSITLAGDSAQRASPQSGFESWQELLRRLGMEGTSISPLQVGYRSTEEIMAFATHVLGELKPDRPWTAVRRGLPVELLRFGDVGQAVAVIAEALQGLILDEPNAYVALIARHAEQADLYFEGLSRTGLQKLRRVRDQDFAFEPGIEVTDVSQVKGLEFDYVILLDVDAATYPEDPASRYLLHIASTRAAHQLWLVACREPSPLLPARLSVSEY